MPVWTIFFLVGIFVLACSALIGLWLLCEHSHPKQRQSHSRSRRFPIGSDPRHSPELQRIAE